MSLLFSHDAVTGKGVGTDASEASAERKLSATLGGDVTIAGTHIYVDKSVPFDKAKAEIEKFARENGASVVKAYKAGFKDFWGFDLSKGVATDAACDAKAWELESECEKIVGGGASVGISGSVVSVDDTVPFAVAKTRVAQFASKHGASIVSAQEVPRIHGYEFKLSKRIAEDADDVKDGNGKPIRVGGKVQVEPSRGWHIKTPWGLAVGKVTKILPNKRVEVDFGQGDKTQIEATACVCVDSAETEDAAFLAGEKVKFIKGELNGKVGEYVRELGVGTHIVKVDGAERRCSSGEFRVYSAALGDSAETEDAADLRVKRIPLTGKWCVEPNISMFGGGAERLGAERKHFETREDAEKYAKGTGKTYRVVDSAACDGLFEDMSRLDGNLDKAAWAVESCDVFSAPREVLTEVRKAKQAIKAAIDNLHKFVDNNKMY